LVDQPSGDQRPFSLGMLGEGRLLCGCALQFGDGIIEAGRGEAKELLGGKTSKLKDSRSGREEVCKDRTVDWCGAREKMGSNN